VCTHEAAPIDMSRSSRIDDTPVKTIELSMMIMA
jgi:hypothetical protein